MIYLSGSSNFLGLIAKLAPIIIKERGLTPVFKVTDSCTGARSMYPCAPGTSGCSSTGFSLVDHYIKDPAPGGTYAKYYDTDVESGGHECLLGGAVEVDVGESEIQQETCGKQKDPRVLHTPGPILPILFVVPRLSQQSAITASAAREVFGNGGNVDPWTDPNYLFVRGPNTATNRLIGRAIDVPVPTNQFWGADQGSAQRMAQTLESITDAETAQHAIGLLGSDTYDIDRIGMKALAFQAKGQTCAYVPDSSLDSYDKRNVRDGHYPIWGTLHFFTAMTPGVTDPAADQFVSLFAITRSDDLMQAFIQASWIPECAMLVQHQTDLGDPTSTPYPVPCGCFFDASVKKGKAQTPDCVQCGTDDDCKDPRRPRCNYHYCEAAPPP